MKSLFHALLVTFLLSPVAFAHDHGHGHDHGQLGTLKGEHLGLFYSDHAISGHVKGNLVFAAPLEKEYGIRLENRTQGRTMSSELRKNGNLFSGRIPVLDEKGSKREIELVASKVSAKDGVIEGTLAFVGGPAPEPFRVKISSKTMEGNHYVDPLFEVSVGEKAYHFQLVGGTACIGCALKITYVVLGMLRTTGVL